MSADDGKTQEPTERGRRRAREEGKVAFSADLVGAAVLVAGVASISFIASWIGKTVPGMVGGFFSAIGDPSAETNPGLLLRTGIGYTALLAAIPLAAVCVAAVVSSLAQTGFLFLPGRLKPDSSRLRPRGRRGTKPAPFSGAGLYEAARPLIKTIAVVAVAALMLPGQVGRLILSLRHAPAVSLSGLAASARDLALASAAVLAALGLVDYLYRRAALHRSLMLTPAALREERKEEEGDPVNRARLRQGMAGLLAQSPGQLLRASSVLVADPGQAAVALRWDSASGRSPEVTVSARGDAVPGLCRSAATFGLPVVENKALARALCDEARAGSPVPDKYLEAVARVLKGLHGAQRAGGNRERS